MQFIKTRQVKNPERDATQNAGIDFYIPDNTEEFRQDFAAKNTHFTFAPIGNGCWYEVATGIIHIAPHEDVIIPSGIRSKFGPELALIANNKSGIATKKKLVFGASVIDASYQGEWHLHLINTSNKYQIIECGQKIVQFIPHLISTDSVEIIDMSPEEFYTEKTSRGEGWQGSTGIK